MIELRRAWLFTACAFLLFAATWANAQSGPKVSVEPLSASPSGPASVSINGRVAVKLMTSNAELSPSQRAEIVAKRLRAMIGAGADWKKIKVKTISLSRADIVWGETTLLIVTKAEAMSRSRMVPELAAEWAKNIRFLLSLPPLTLTPKSVTIPLGETRQVAVGGAAQGEILGADSSPEVAATSVTPDSKFIVIKALSVGNSVVTIGRGGMTATVDIAVRKYAGSLAVPQSVVVTGRPAPAKLCRKLAEAQVSRCLTLEPGAKASVLAPTAKAVDVKEGEQYSLTFPVKITGEGYIPVATSATVRVVNQAIGRKQVGKLFYSNSPERVERYANLFGGKLALEEPARLLYHHQNMMGKPYAFSIVLVNTGAAPARVQIIEGAPEPEIDTVAVGYKAGVWFLTNLLNDVGHVLDVPPMSKIAVYSRVVDRLLTASGIIQFRQLDGEPMALKVAADLADSGALAENVPLQANSYDGQLAASPWVYPSPTKQLEAKYTVGQTWAFIRMGKQAIKDEAQEQQLYGNYGVLYDIKLQIENPTPESKKVNIVFEPSAGMASGIFTFDGKPVKVTHVSPPKEVSLMQYTLAPNESKSVSIKTIPLSGSNYPATIMVRS